MEQLRIRDESSRIVPMRFSESQEIIWDHVAPDLDENNRLWYIVLKARQIYATTFFENLMFTRTLEAPNVNSLVIAQDIDSSAAIFNMVKRFYDYLAVPKDRPPKARELIIPLNGGTSSFKVVSAGVSAKGRGTTQTALHCSEVAFWPHPEVMTGLSQAMPDQANTLWAVESTANGMVGTGELFYNMWKQAVSRKSKLKPIFIPWFVMSKYREDPALPEGDWDDEERLLVQQFSKYGLDGSSLRWRRGVIATKTGNVELFHQEFPSTPAEAFISSGLPAFDSMAILRQQENVTPAKLQGEMRKGGQLEGKFQPNSNGEVFLWRLPLEGRQYAIGVDTSEGIRGGDYACAQVIRCDNMEQVGLVHGLLQPFEFSRTINELGRWFNNAIVCVETNNTGYAVQDYLMTKWSYPRLHPWKGKANRVSATTKLWGWTTNVYSRPLLIESGRRAIDSNMAIIHDEATIEELRHFTRQDSGKYEASAGHDDRVLALLLAFRTREENYHGAQRRIEVALSEPDLRGVRVVDTSRDQKMREIRRSLIGIKADKAVKHWLAL